MTFRAELKFNDGKKTYTVLDSDYGFTQETDGTGKPSGLPQPGPVTVSLETSSDKELIEWMKAAGNVRSGEITFSKDDAQGTKLKSLEFKDAVCIRLLERFSSYGGTPMITTITFVAKEMKLDGVQFKTQWTNY